MAAPNFDASRFDALIFDCDGTLAVTAGLHYAAIAHGFRGAGHALAEDFYMRRTGLSFDHLLADFAAETGAAPAREAVLDEIVAYYLANTGQIREAERITAVARTWAGRKPLAVGS